MRAWWQQCEDSKTYQGMVQLVIFKLSLKSEPDNNGHVAQLSESESEFMNQSTSGAGDVENPEQLKLIFSCLGFLETISLLKLIKSGLEKSSN